MDGLRLIRPKQEVTYLREELCQSFRATYVQERREGDKERKDRKKCLDGERFLVQSFGLLLSRHCTEYPYTALAVVPFHPFKVPSLKKGSKS